MTLADIRLTLQPPETEPEEATSQTALFIMCHNAQEIWDMRQKLTREDLIELADWKFKLM